MNILAIETSTERATIALSWQGALEEVELASPPAHSATLLPAIRRLLDAKGARLDALDRIACGVGPGSFTGVRLACSVSQGLALGSGRPLVAIGSLDALARQAGSDRVYCALDARMHECYVAAWAREGTHWRAMIEPCCVAPADLPEPAEGRWTCIGTAFAAYPEAAARAARWADGPLQHAHPRASAMIELAAAAPLIDPAVLSPLYVRDRVAYTIAERLARGGKA